MVCRGAEATRAASGLLYRSLETQASMLSYIDVFHVLMWVVFICLPLVLLMQAPKAGAKGEGWRHENFSPPRHFFWRPARWARLSNT